MLFGCDRYVYQLEEDWPKCLEGFTFNDVSGLAIDSYDNVFLFNRGPHPVMVFDRAGNYLKSWGEGRFTSEHGIGLAKNGSIVYCTDGINHTVSKFTADGKLLKVLGKRDQPSDTGYVFKGVQAIAMKTIKRGGPPFNRATGVTESPSGDIYISDGYGNARVHRFNPDGKLLLSWGEPGTGPGQFRLPHAVRMDNRNRVWVADRENNRIQIFNTDGKFMRQLMGLKRPTDICFDNEGTVYVSELGLRISIFTPNGKLLTRWGSPGINKKTELFVAPHTIAVDSKGDLYVGEVAKSFGKVDRGTKALRKFVRKYK